MEKKSSINLTKKDIYYLLNKKKIKRGVAFYWFLSISYLLFLSVLLFSGNLINFVSFLKNLMWLFVGSGAFMVCRLPMYLDKKDGYLFALDRIKSFINENCPDIKINEKNFSIVRGSVINNLENVVGCSKLFSKDLNVGTLSTQYVVKIKDEKLNENGVIGAIEEVATNSIKSFPTKFGIKEKVESKYEYKWVPASEVRPYESKTPPLKIRKK